MSRVTGAPVALAGCGAVGGALTGLLSDAGVALDAHPILVRTPERHRALRPGLNFTGSVETFLTSDAPVVVELLGGVDTAREVVETALGRGAHVVTANKALIAAHGPELVRLAERTGGSLRFDAAVGGGVPVVRTLQGALSGIPVARISGILNGTANFLLTRFEEGVPEDEALREAQEEGYAEADPARDLDGRDVEDKLRVLAWVAWGALQEELRVDRSGLPDDAAEWAVDAYNRGARVRLVAEAERVAGGVRATVACREVARDSEAGRARGVENFARIETACGTYVLSGPGAGGPPTAAAVLADVRAAVASATTPPLRYHA